MSAWPRQYRKPLRWGVLAALSAVALCAGMQTHAARFSERNKQQQAAEAERAELQQKLNALKQDISRTELARGHAADSLAQSETAISEANRTLHELIDEQRKIETKIRDLTAEQARLSQAVANQQQRLARLLRDQYVAGKEDRIKLLLSGDNPNRINRELQYMGYVSLAQARLIQSLRANLAAIETNKAATQEARAELAEIVREQNAQKAQFEKEKARRSTLLAQLSNKLAEQRKEAGNIEHDEQRLGALVERLGKLVEEQRKAEAAAAEKRRQEQQEQLARTKAHSSGEAAASKMSSIKAKTPNPDAIDNDEPRTKLLARNELTPHEHVQDGIFSQAFGALRGQLRLPVKGDVLAKFGSKRGDGPPWKGLFIRAPEGAQVKAVAGGRVVFADWLRGFGNLVIIDHGSEYMTIYGNNQAVLKRVGDLVKTGDIIANAGNSGGNEQSGLYFEMRHQGRAFDPLTWVTIR